MSPRKNKSEIEPLLPAILKWNINGFGGKGDLVWYKLFKENKLKDKTGTEWYFELKNKKGVEIVVEATSDIFSLYRIK
jgi:hypothetical protein